MAQIKVLKIGSDGYTTEHDSVNDEITLSTLASNSLTIDADLVLDSSGILVPSGKSITITDSPSTGSDAVNKDYIQSYVQGLDPQQSVLDKDIFNAPGSPSTGNRYIIAAARNDAIISLNQGSKIFTIAGDHTADYTTGDIIKVKGSTGNNGYYTVVSTVLNGSDTDITVSESIPNATADGNIYLAGTTWRQIGVDIIAEYNGTSWVYTTPNIGFNTYVEDENVTYVYNSSLSWVTLNSTQNHNYLSGLQGGLSNEYYHFSNAEHTYIQNVKSKISDYNNFVAKNVSEAITGTWTFSRAILTEVRLPTAQPITPVAGDVYTSSGVLYVYDGTNWIMQGESGDPVLSDYVLDSGLGSGTYYGKIVRITSTNNEVTPAQADSVNNTKATFGFIATTGTIAGGDDIKVQENGVITGILSGATPGTTYFLDGTTAGNIATSPPNAGTVLIVGYAKNATDLQIKIETIRVRA